MWACSFWESRTQQTFSRRSVSEISLLPRAAGAYMTMQSWCAVAQTKQALPQLSGQSHHNVNYTHLLLRCSSGPRTPSWASSAA